MINNISRKLFIEMMNDATQKWKAEAEKWMREKANEILKEEMKNMSDVKTDNPLFTLTAEEVEKEEQILGAALLKYVELYHANKQTSTANDWKEVIDYCHKQLTRIKQWQDENNRTDG